jgi:4-amino-4-deoxy-L-arabinose transferase-like glycosyltransferase
MRPSMVRPSLVRSITYGVIAAVGVIALRNAFVYPAIAGYDAQEALDYARGVVHGHLPAGTGSYYTPPGFFAVGGVAIELGDRLGLDHPERLGQLVNALAAVGTLVLLLMLVRLLWPGRKILHLAAVVFFAVCPVVLKSAAMFHPEPLSMLFSTAALVLAVRLLSRPDRRLVVAVLLGLALGLAQLVRAWTLWTFGVVVVVLAVAALTRERERRSLLAALGVAAAIAVLVPAPWYVHQVREYNSALFGQPQPTESIWSRRPIGFFVGGGLPDVVTHPYRPAASHHFAAVAFDEAWGDYFGVWRWGVQTPTPTSGVRRELVTMSIVGLALTLLAVAGWLALLALAVRHPGRHAERQLVALLPLAALAGTVYFATKYPTADGDTVKGSFMLTAVPAWAACFGFAFDELRLRFRASTPVLLAVLALAAVAAAPFLLAVSRL